MGAKLDLVTLIEISLGIWPTMLSIFASMFAVSSELARRVRGKSFRSLIYMKLRDSMYIKNL
jgi:hypothetical protein